MPSSDFARRLFPALALSILTVATPFLRAADAPPLHRGYYSDPAVHGDTVVFTSEGDLWTVDIHGGAARRLTSGAGTEHAATISPDGKTVAFSGAYDGPSEVYTIPIEGGMPQRLTWNGNSAPASWAPDGRLLVSTSRYSGLPATQLVLIDQKGANELIPLEQAAEGAYSTDGKTLFFTRWFAQSSNTKRYKGGSAENIWRFDGEDEAVPLTADWTGTSAHPMFWNDRVYFLSDRDGVMNVWSMDSDGHGVRQESHQHIFDIKAASLSDGRIVYASGSDLWSLDLKSGHEEIIPITLVSDFDQMREHWVAKPLEFLTSVHISPDGSSAVFTARGEVFTLPAKSGRIVKVAGDSAVRYREATFLPDGKSIVALSTQTGETEFWKFAANGEGAPEQWTHDAKVLRWNGVPSPDGRWLAHHDKDEQLWIYDTKSKQDKLILKSMVGGIDDLRWSPDSRWLAFAMAADNQFEQIKVLNVESGDLKTLTSDRYNSSNPLWTSDGKWLYFLSDRNLKTTVNSPWGARQPAPHFDRTVRIYELALTPGLRSPFLPADELHPDTADKKDDEKNKDATAASDKTTDVAKSDADKNKKDDAKKDEAKDKKKPADVKIDFTDMETRLSEVLAPPGNYDSLQATEKRLCWLNASDSDREKRSLQCFDIANKGDEVETVLADVKSFEISLDQKKMLVRKGDDFYVFDSSVKPTALADLKTLKKAAIDLSHWKISTTPRDEFHGIFLDAWRLERDYFYDRNMQGVDWIAMRDRYLPLVDRVANRDELNAVIAQMVGELSALHIFVRRWRRPRARRQDRACNTRRDFAAR